MARADWPRRIVQCPPGISDARCGCGCTAADSLPQLRKYQRGSAGRAEPHPAGNLRRGGGLVAVARTAPSRTKPRSRLGGAPVALLHYFDRGFLVKLPRNVISKPP